MEHRHAPHPMSCATDAVIESPRRTPVHAEVDVLVCGGGPAGVGAAMAAAACGARTMLLERHGMLGGVWTAGLLNPCFEAERQGWLVEDLIARLRAAGAWHAWKPWASTFDTETMKLLLEERFADLGIAWRYHVQVADSIVEDGHVRGVVAEGKGGRFAVLVHTTIDATGDGDVAARAGARFALGRDGDGRLQPMTLVFRIAGAAGFRMDGSAELFDLLARAVDGTGIRLPFTRGDKAPWIIHTPEPDIADVQATHIYALDPLDLGPADGAFGRTASALIAASADAAPGAGRAWRSGGVDPAAWLTVEARLRACLAVLVQTASDVVQLPTTDDAVRRALALIAGTSGGVTPAALAAAAGLSRSQLDRRFRAALGRSPRAVIAAARLAAAEEALAAGRPLAAVAHQAGFTHATYFSAWFRRATGLPPAAWARATHA